MEDLALTTCVKGCNNFPLQAALIFDFFFFFFLENQAALKLIREAHPKKIFDRRKKEIKKRN